MSNGSRLAGAAVAGGISGALSILILLIGSVLLTGDPPHPRFVVFVLIIAVAAGCVAWRNAEAWSRWLDADSKR